MSDKKKSYGLLEINACKRQGSMLPCAISATKTLDEHAFYDCVRTNSDDIFRGSLGIIYVPVVGRDRYHGSSYLRQTEAFPSIRKCHLLVRWNFSLFLPRSNVTEDRYTVAIVDHWCSAHNMNWQWFTSESLNPHRRSSIRWLGLSSNFPEAFTPTQSIKLHARKKIHFKMKYAQ